MMYRNRNFRKMFFSSINSKDDWGAEWLDLRFDNDPVQDHELASGGEQTFINSPALTEWMMGFPMHWTDLAHVETQ